jgi:hypothetical protein
MLREFRAASRLCVAGTLVRDLLVHAKHLSVAALVADSGGLPASPAARGLRHAPRQQLRSAAYASNEQIFGAKQQVPHGEKCDHEARSPIGLVCAGGCP